MNTNIIEFEDRKPNANNVLANLPPADRDQIKDWLQIYSYTATVDKINAPRPEGLGLKIHYTSLRNYYLDHIQPEKLVEQQADQDQIQDLTAVSAKIPYLTAVSNRLQKRLFDLSLNPEAPLKEIERLLRLVLRIENLQLKQQQLALAREQLQAPVGAQAFLPTSNTKTQEQRTHCAEIGSKTPSEPLSAPYVNKEKQELSSFHKPLPVASQPISIPLTQKVILSAPNLPLPAVFTSIKK